MKKLLVALALCITSLAFGAEVEISSSGQGAERWIADTDSFVKDSGGYVITVIRHFPPRSDTTHIFSVSYETCETKTGYLKEYVYGQWRAAKPVNLKDAHSVAEEIAMQICAGGRNNFGR